MIKRIEAKNYRSLRYINQEMDSFHVLVGPNASGKSTFMDIVSFLSDILKLGIDEAIRNRSANFNDLTFSMKGGDIEFAINVELPDNIKKQYQHGKYEQVRYEIRIGLTEVTKEHAIKEEKAVLLSRQDIPGDIKSVKQRTLFPELIEVPSTIFRKPRPICDRLILRKKPGGNDNFYPENYKESGKGGYMPSFKFGVKRSALGNLPADETKFPAATWLKEFLLEGVQLFILDSQNIKKASPPGQSKKFKTDGSNLPWVINDLRNDEKQFKKWIKHIQTALPEIVDIDTVEREDDKHRYLRVSYENKIRVPSWLVSDGTLRLLALSLPAYLPDFFGVYLIEEPENGIHPKAVETVFDSLSSIYNAQILFATHSTVILSLIDPKKVLCFAKTNTGVTDIVSGFDHPALKDWRGEANFSVLFASGILG